jgi:hypothetical protein
MKGPISLSYGVGYIRGPEELVIYLDDPFASAGWESDRRLNSGKKSFDSHYRRMKGFLINRCVHYSKFELLKLMRRMTKKQRLAAGEG